MPNPMPLDVPVTMATCFLLIVAVIGFLLYLVLFLSH